MDLGLRGKVAIVTGSSDGIGYATALALAREGVRVVLCARRQAPLAEARDAIAKETGAELLAVTCDVQQLSDVQRLVTETIQRFGTIRILINNAGSVPSMLSWRLAELRSAYGRRPKIPIPPLSFSVAAAPRGIGTIVRGT